MSEAAVSVCELGMIFPGKHPGETITVLENITAEVMPGEFVCFVGPSGCGKSTLLNIIAGFLSPTAGDAFVEGIRVTRPDPRRIFVFQEKGVFPWLIGRENISFGLRARTRDEQNEIVARYVEMVGLNGFGYGYPRELSGGMRQRVEIARALAADPDIIYMDAPFGALAYLTRLRMRADLIRIRRAERKTILLVTHDIEEAVQLADRIFVMSARPATVKAAVTV